MGIMRKLALRQLRLNRRRTIMTLIGVVIAVMMITALAGFATSTQGMMKDVLVATNGDYHVAVLNVTDEQAKEILNDPLVESGFIRNETLYNDDGAYEVKGAFVRLAEPSSSYDKTAAELAKNHGVKDPAYTYHKELLALEGYIANEELMIALYVVIAVLIGVIVIGSIVVISNAFSMSANERLRQFGILKSTGATRRQIMNSVVFEGFYIATIGIPIGVAAGLALEALALAIANNLLSDLFAYIVRASSDSIQFHVVFSWSAVGIAALISLATILIAAWRPARRASKISAIDAIRLSGEIKISDKKVRTSRLTAKLFGFEGTLAARALKRSKRQYRATVVSLVIGIVLYLVSSGFGASITQALEATYVDYGVNVTAMAYTHPEKAKGLNEKITEASGSERVYYSSRLDMMATMQKDIFTENAERYMANGDMKHFLENMYANIISVDKAWYAELSKEAGIEPGAQKAGSAIAFNFAKTFQDGKSVTYRPLNLSSGDNTLNVKGDGMTVSDESGGTLNIAGEINKAKGPMLALVDPVRINLIVPEETFRSLLSDGDVTNTVWLTDAKDPQAVYDEWTKIGEGETGYNVMDISKNDAITKSMNMLMMIFVYGFIAMLSLIGITSVISAIQTNIGLRAREFAMLSSVGMTPGGRRRMLNLESLFYGAKALLIGIPIGLALSYLMYYMIGSNFGFAFVVPWLSIAIVIGAVFVIVFATMRYASSRLAGTSIIETLRGVE